MTSVLIKKTAMWEQRYRERMSCDDKDKYWTYATASKGLSKTDGKPAEARKRQARRSLQVSGVMALLTS